MTTGSSSSVLCSIAISTINRREQDMLHRGTQRERIPTINWLIVCVNNFLLVERDAYLLYTIYMTGPDPDPRLHRKCCVTKRTFSDFVLIHCREILTQLCVYIFACWERTLRAQLQIIQHFLLFGLDALQILELDLETF